MNTKLIFPHTHTHGNGHNLHTTNSLILPDRVNHAPLITKPPVNATVLLGASITFPCKVLSDLHKHIQWGYQRKESDKIKKIDLKVMVVACIGSFVQRCLVAAAFLYVLCSILFIAVYRELIVSPRYSGMILW